MTAPILPTDGPASHSEPPKTLLATLQAYTTLQQTRRSLQLELDQALSSFLTQTPASLASLQSTTLNGGDGGDGGTEGVSTCATEAVRPPNEAELQQVLKIGFGGLLEVRGEAEILRTLLDDTFGRRDLARVVQEIERLEGERLKETIQRDQYRRLATLEPDRDFAQVVSAHEQKQRELAQAINEESREITAEIADLSAGAEGEATEA